MAYQLDIDDLKSNYALAEYNALRNDDPIFEKEWKDNDKDFNEWFEDVFYPSFKAQMKK